MIVCLLTARSMGLEERVLCNCKICFWTKLLASTFSTSIDYYSNKLLNRMFRSFQNWEIKMENKIDISIAWWSLMSDIRPIRTSRQTSKRPVYSFASPYQFFRRHHGTFSWKFQLKLMCVLNFPANILAGERRKVFHLKSIFDLPSWSDLVNRP